jgi:hypothetical protein
VTKAGFRAVRKAFSHYEGAGYRMVCECGAVQALQADPGWVLGMFPSSTHGRAARKWFEREGWSIRPPRCKACAQEAQG